MQSNCKKSRADKEQRDKKHSSLVIRHALFAFREALPRLYKREVEQLETVDFLELSMHTYASLRFCRLVPLSFLPLLVAASFFCAFKRS